MPSGSKKRKSSKKPKPQGGPPELEPGFEEAMENDGMEVGEATPSPRGFEGEGDPEAMAERGLEGKEMNGEVSQEGVAPKEGFQTDEAAPDQDEGGQCDPPSQAEPEPEIPAGIEAEAPAVFELEGEPAQGETELQIDTPLVEFEAKTDPAPEEIKPQTESDAVPVELEPVTDATPDASPPEEDMGLVEDESSKESSVLERESVLDAAPIGNESGRDESYVEMETETDAASAHIEPEIDKALDEVELETDGAVESEISGPLVEVKPEPDAIPYIELETNDSPDEVPVEAELEMDGAPAESKPEMEEAQVEELESAAPADIGPESEEGPMEREPETDVTPMDAEAEAEEALAERELAIDAAPVYVDPVTDAAPADTEAETDTARVQIHASPDEIPPEIDAVSPENETIEIEPDVNAALVEAEQDEVSQAEIEAAPEPEPEVEALVEGESEVSAEDVHNSAEIDAKMEPPQDTEPMPKPLDVTEDTSPQEIEPLDVAEDTSLQPPQEIEPESVVVATDEAKPEDEVLVETKADERGSVETESYQQDLVEGEMEAPLEIDPEPEVTSRGIELEAEAEAPLEPEPEPVLEPPAEIELDQKGHIEMVADQQDLVEIEPDQSGVKEHDQQLQKLEREDLGEVDTSVSEDNQPSESQPQVANASVIEDEPPAISASDEANSVDDSTSSISTSDSSDNTKNERTAIEQEPEEGDDIPPSATVLDGEGESTGKSVSDNQDSVLDVEQARGTAVDNEQVANDELPDESKDISEQDRAVDAGRDEDGAVPASAGNGGETEKSSEQELVIELSPADVVDVAESTWKTAVDNEQGAADELPDDSKEDISEQERGVDVGHDEDGAVLASAGNGGEIEESSEQELAIELPLADVVDVAESTWGTAVDNEQGAADELPDQSKEDINEQERAVDVGHHEDRAVLASAGNGGEVEVASEQELGIDLPPCDVADVEESANKERPLPSDQEPVAEQPQPLIDEQELSTGIGAAADEPPSAEQSLSATLPSSESETPSEAPEPQDEAITPENDENIASEHESNLELVCGELERDIGEEEMASSTVAEAGSVLNDFDERASCEQELPTDFLSTDQDVDIHDFKDFGDTLSIESHESETRLREQFDSEPSPAEKVNATAGCGLEATSEQQEVPLEGAVAKPAEDLHCALVEEVSSDDQLLSSPQPEQVVQVSGEDKVHSSKEIVRANEELRTAEEERATCVDTTVASKVKVRSSKEIVLANEELRTAEEERATYEDTTAASKEKVRSSIEVVPANEELTTAEEERATCEDTTVASKDKFSREGKVRLSKEIVLANEELRTTEEERATCEDTTVASRDKIRSSKEIVLANEELRTAEEEIATCEDTTVASKYKVSGEDKVRSSKEIVLANEELRTSKSILGTSPMIAGDELISKAFQYLENGQQSLSSSEGPNNGLVKHIDESSVYQSGSSNRDKAEIHAMDTKELKEAEHNQMGGDYDADEALLESVSLIPEGRDMKGVQAFRQESIQEASLPVVVPAQDRALEHVSLKSPERPSEGGTLQRRTKLLSCCGMFDLLLRKN